MKVSPTSVRSSRCKLLQTSIEACPSIYHTCSIALKARKAASMTTKAMKAMKGMKAMKTTGVKVKKSKTRKPKIKAMKKAMIAMKTKVRSPCEIVVSVCRRCRSAQEIVGVQAPVLTLREYYCLQCASPVAHLLLSLHVVATGSTLPASQAAARKRRRESGARPRLCWYRDLTGCPGSGQDIIIKKRPQYGCKQCGRKFTV